ncbi:hypothetical protein TNCV_1489911 [Trichonephila clavipes]|nr:hypothetical protein TNCV_1489911 [Trichonephila clavipes]
MLNVHQPPTLGLVYPLGAWGRRPGARKGPDKLDLTRFPGYKFRSSTKRACRTSAYRIRKGSSLNRHFPIRRVFSGTRFELMIRCPRVRASDH